MIELGARSLKKQNRRDNPWKKKNPLWNSSTREINRQEILKTLEHQKGAVAMLSEAICNRVCLLYKCTHQTPSSRNLNILSLGLDITLRIVSSALPQKEHWGSISFCWLRESDVIPQNAPKGYHARLHEVENEVRITEKGRKLPPWGEKLAINSPSQVTESNVARFG